MLIIAAFSFAVYINSLGNEFVFDDESVVLGDPSITSISNIPKYFTGEEGFHKVIGKYYRPVVSASYAFDYALWKYNPFGFHLTNVIINTINSVLVYILLVLFFRKVSFRYKKHVILISSVIFAVHPIHTEAVAWVSGRTDSLCAMFYFAAFIFYLKFNEQNNRIILILSYVSYSLALLCKEMAVTLPVVIVLFDIIIERKNAAEIKKRLILYAVFVLVTLLYFILRETALTGVTDRKSYYYFYGRDTLVVIFTMLQTLPLYFRLSVIPYNLLYHYNGYLPYQYSVLSYTVLLGIFFIFAVILISVYLFRKIPAVSYSLLFFILTLFPVMNIVPTMNFMAERFLYIPSLFISFLCAGLIFNYYSERIRNIISAFLLIVISYYSVLTVMRNTDWKDNNTLFLSASGRPGTVLYVNIGNYYANQQKYDIAEGYYRKALDINENLLLANNNLGKIFMLRGNFDSAYYYMHRAYMLDTLSPEPPFAIGQLYISVNEFKTARPWLEKARTIKPGYMEVDKILNELDNMEKFSHTKPDTDVMQRIAELEKSSYLYYQNKEYARAVKDLEELIKLNPSDAAGYYNNIGMCYLETGDYNTAIIHFRKSLEKNPAFSTAYNNMGTCYEKLGDTTKAIESYARAVENDPLNNTAAENLKRLRK